jgi:hypothetical protein
LSSSGKPQTSTYKSNQFNIGISPMLTYTFTPRFRLISRFGGAGFYFSSGKSKIDNGNWSDLDKNLNFDTNFNTNNFSFGIEYLF